MPCLFVARSYSIEWLIMIHFRIPRHNIPAISFRPELCPLNVSLQPKRRLRGVHIPGPPTAPYGAPSLVEGLNRCVRSEEFGLLPKLELHTLPSMDLIELSWPAVAALSKDTPVVFPIAALEQHGP